MANKPIAFNTLTDEEADLNQFKSTQNRLPSVPQGQESGLYAQGNNPSMPKMPSLGGNAGQNAAYQQKMKKAALNRPTTYQPGLGPAEYKNLWDMAKGALGGLNQMAGVQDQGAYRPMSEGDYRPSYQADTLQGSGNPLGFNQQPSAVVALPFNQRQQNATSIPGQQATQEAQTLSEGNQDALNGVNQTAQPVDVINMNYSTGGLMSPEAMRQQETERVTSRDEPRQTGQNLPGNEFLPDGNTLPATPNIGAGGVPSFSGDYAGNYDSREINEARAKRNEEDALTQDRRSAAMVARLNRGTQAMSELRQMRSGVRDGQGFNSANLGGDIRQGLPIRSEFDDYEPKSGRGKVAKQEVLQRESQNKRMYDLAKSKGNIPILNESGYTTEDALTAAPTQKPGDALAERKFQFDQQKYQEGKEISAKDKQLAWNKYKANPKNTFNEMIMDRNLTLALDDIRKSGNDPARISAFNKNFQLPYETVMQLFQQYGKSDSLLPMG